MDYSPPYWNEKKGEIIKAIAIDWCFTFRNVQNVTNFAREELYKLIGELMAKNIIYVYDDQYRVKKEIYHEYWDYAVHYSDLPEKIFEDSNERLDPKNETKYDNNIVDWVNKWIIFQKNYDKEISVHNEHFYLDGSLLPNFIHDLVRRAKKDIVYIAPWIEEIGVTKNLMSASLHGKHVVVVTRQPDKSSNTDWGKRRIDIYEKCHSNMENSGITVCYNNEIHGKVLAIDDKVAVVSSFNLLKNPASGLSWEAGIVSFDPEIVNSINESIRTMVGRT